MRTWNPGREVQLDAELQTDHQREKGDDHLLERRLADEPLRQRKLHGNGQQQEQQQPAAQPSDTGDQNDADEH